MHYEAPGFYKDAFNCPNCNAYAKMIWKRCYVRLDSSQRASIDFHVAVCSRCEEPNLWKGEQEEDFPSGTSDEEAEDYNSFLAQQAFMVHPQLSIAPQPNPDLPENCRDDYMEARDIFARSPRAAAALLRLVVQKLCKHFGEPGRDINQDIGRLVDKGLPRTLQKALDTVRVIGNEAVHPGELDLNDSPEVVAALFKLVNLIVEKMITEPKQIAELYQTLPEKKLQGIEQRDKPKP